MMMLIVNSYENDGCGVDDRDDGDKDEDVNNDDEEEVNDDVDGDNRS